MRGGVGFVLSHIPQNTGPVLWIQDRLSRKEAGRPSLSGLGLSHPLLMARLSHPRDVLIATEEGLRCAALSAVVAEIWGDPPTLSFTATKRLALRAEASGVPCWLIRRAASPNLSAARDRWRVASLASSPDRDDPVAPGDPRWRVELFRSRDKKTGVWVARYDRTTDRVDYAAVFRDGAVAEDGAKGAERAAR